MELVFLGGAREVGASCTLLEVAGHHILIDGGMRPAAKADQPRLPDLTTLDKTPPEALLITHAHIDHTGALPLIASLYPHIPIYATESTRVLAEILLRDSVRIMEQEGLAPDKETPLYNAEQVDALLGRITSVNFQQPFAPLPEVSSVYVRFLPAGHILGAAMLYIETPDGTLLHTGDISVTDQRTIKGLDMPTLPQADVMICEGTYGNRLHTNRKDEERKLAETVQQTLARGGRVLCPTFAIGRAQEVTLILKAYRASGKVSPVPIYLDGMVRSVCTAYQNQSHDLHPHLQRYLTNARRPLFADPDMHVFAVRSQDRAALLGKSTPMVVISSSGMLSGGASPLYAAEMAQREQDCIIFSGYQDEESPGSAMLNAQQGSRLPIGEQSVTVNCQVTRYNLSGHADAEQIAHAVARVNPKQLVLVHGAPDALETLGRRFSRLEVEIPAVGSRLTIKPYRSTISARPPRPSASSAPTTPARTSALPQPPPSPPTIHDLWTVAVKFGPTRPWTAVELGQHYYGTNYQPALRAQVELVLKEASPYFKQGRIGAQPTYLPRSASTTEQLRPISQLTAGEVVLVQGQKGTPQIALLLSAPREGTVSLVADQWKEGIRPMNLVQLFAGIRREDLLALPRHEIKQQLQEWRKALDDLWIDLFAWWDHCMGKAFTFASLYTQLESDDLRLAWGMELLAHGHELFVREGTTWTPFHTQRVLANPGFAHHLALVHAGAGTMIIVGGQRATLTGRSNWRQVEVCRIEGGKAEEIVRVRASHVQIPERIPMEEASDRS